MTGNTGVVGRLAVADGKGAVRMEVRLDCAPGEVWSALTDPARLGHWYGEVTGDLRAGGEYRARLFASGWEGTGRVEVCEPERHLVVTSAEPAQPDANTSAVTLAADGPQTVLTWEERGMPAAYVAAFGAGVQIHVEDLAAHLAGGERGDASARFPELLPYYEDLAARLS